VTVWTFWLPAGCDTAVDVLQMLHEETDGKAVITTGVGQHQMWAAQWYDYNLPRHWATSGELQLGHAGSVALFCPNTRALIACQGLPWPHQCMLVQ
jgi:hypothetical protein